MPYTLKSTASAQNSGGGTNGTAFVTLDTVSATLLVAFVGEYNFGSTYTPNPVTDTQSNHWVGPISYGDLTVNPRISAWFCLNPTTNGASVITANVIANSYPCLCVATFANSTATAGLENNNRAITTGASVLNTGSISPTKDNSLLVAGVIYQDTTPITGSAGFTMGSQVVSSGTSEGGGIAYSIQTTATTAGCQFNWTNSVAATAMILCFVPQQSGGGGGPVSGNARGGFVNRSRMPSNWFDEQEAREHFERQEQRERFANISRRPQRNRHKAVQYA